MEYGRYNELLAQESDTKGGRRYCIWPLLRSKDKIPFELKYQLLQEIPGYRKVMVRDTSRTAVRIIPRLTQKPNLSGWRSCQRAIIVVMLFLVPRFYVVWRLLNRTVDSSGTKKYGRKLDWFLLSNSSYLRPFWNQPTCCSAIQHTIPPELHDCVLFSIRHFRQTFDCRKQYKPRCLSE